MTKQYVIVSLQETNMTCALGTTAQAKIHLSHITSYPLEYNEYSNNTLFGSSRIHTYVTHFIETHSTLNTQLIIYTQTTALTRTNYALLQHALGLSKNHIKIAAIIPTPPNLFSEECLNTENDACPQVHIIKKNLLSSFIPNTHATITPWIIFFLIGTSATLGVCAFMYISLNKEIIATTQSINNLQNVLIKNQAPVQKAKLLKQKITFLETPLSQEGIACDTFPNLLKEIEQSIPETAYITTCKLIAPQPKQKDSKISYTYTIEGYTDTPSTISRWLQHLAHSSTCIFTLTSLAMANTSPSAEAPELPYSFVINAIPRL